MAGSAADAGNEGDSKRIVDECVAKFGALDGYFANAGVVGTVGPMLAQEVSDWTTTLRVNTIGCAPAPVASSPANIPRRSGCSSQSSTPRRRC